MSKKALEGSIKKWEQIVKSTQAKDNGGSNCSLCQEYYSEKCNGCPVAIKTGEPCCDGSPYHQWADHLAEDHEFFGMPISRQPYCRKCLELARKELKFLESLRELYKEAP